MSPSKIEGLSDADSVYETVKPLDTFFQRKTYAEIKTLMDTHFFGKDQTVEVNEVDDDDDDSDSISPASSVPFSNSEDEDEKMKDILKDL
jgi:hypothetical protein